RKFVTCGLYRGRVYCVISSQVIALDVRATRRPSALDAPFPRNFFDQNVGRMPVIHVHDKPRSDIHVLWVWFEPPCPPRDGLVSPLNGWTRHRLIWFTVVPRS